MSKCNLAYGLTDPGPELFTHPWAEGPAIQASWALSIDVMNEADTEVLCGSAYHSDTLCQLPQG